MRTPLFPLTFAFILGIVIGNAVQINNMPLLIALTFLFFFMLPFPLKKIRFMPGFALFAAFTILGILGINAHLHAQPEPTHVSRIDYSGVIGLEGTVCEPPVRTPEKTNLVIESARVVQNGLAVPVKERVLLAVNETSRIPRYGDFIRVKVKLKHPHNFKNPGSFDYEKHLRLKGILVRGYIDNPDNIVLIRQNTGNPFFSGMQAFRDKLRNLIRRNAPPDQAAVLIAMVIGEQNAIPKDLLAKFNRTGTTHILAISGFNVGLVFLFSILAIQAILKSSEYLLLRFNMLVISTFIAAIPVIVYTFIAGLGMSVIRASIMILALVASVVLEKERDLPNTLFFAALIMLAFHPPALFDVSFQLSFAAVAAIIFIAPKFSDLLKRKDPVEKLDKPGFFRSGLRVFLLFLIVTISASLGAVPLTMYYFNAFSSMVILANLLLIPLMGYAVTFLSMIIIVTEPLSSALSGFIVKISAMLIRISTAIVDRLSTLPLSSINTTTPTLYEISAYYILLISAVYLIARFSDRKRKSTEFSGRRTKVAVTAVTLAIIFFIADGFYFNLRDGRRQNLSVTFIDVGQGSSTLVRMPGGKKMLIDGGGFHDDLFDIGKNVIAPFLWREKIKVIDTVVLTHPHPDHLNGLLFILEHFNVKEVWSNGTETQDEPYLKFKKIIKEKNMTHRILGNGSKAALGRVSVRVLNPAKHVLRKRIPDRLLNDRSLVLQMRFNKVSFLFPGDVSSVVEKKIKRQCRNIRSQILLSPHHGSRFSNSSQFIKKVRPELVVFSCGKDNIFGLPAREVLDRYRSLGVRIFRTDRDGAVTIETDGEKIISESACVTSPGRSS